MDWAQAFTVGGITLGAVWYMHRENSRMFQEMKNEVSREMKDFHGRLCALEERYIQMMERFMEERNSR